MLPFLRRPSSLLCRIPRITFVRYYAGPFTRHPPSSEPESQTASPSGGPIHPSLENVSSNRDGYSSPSQVLQTATPLERANDRGLNPFPFEDRSQNIGMNCPYPAETAVGGRFNLNERMDNTLRSSHEYTLGDFLLSTANVRKKTLKMLLETDFARDECQPQNLVTDAEEWVDQVLLVHDDLQHFTETWSQIPKHLSGFVAARVVHALLEKPDSLVRLLAPMLPPGKTEWFRYYWLVEDTMFYLYQYFLYQNLRSGILPRDFYECLMAFLPHRGPWNFTLLNGLPNYFLHQRCPLDLRKRLLRACNLRGGLVHWESLLLESQRLSAKGMITQAIQCLLHAASKKLHRVPYTVEFHNAMTTILKYAQQTTSDIGPEEVVIQLLQRMLGFVHIHDATFRALISYATANGSHRGLLEISKVLQTSARIHHPSIQVELVAAMTKVGMNPIEAQNISQHQVLFLPDQKKYYPMNNNSFFRNSLFLLGGKHAKSEGRQLSFRESLPQFEQFFRTDLLQQLGLPCSFNQTKDALHPTNIPTAVMLKRYFQDHQYDPKIVHDVYHKFLQSLNYNAEHIRIATWPDARVHNTILQGLIRTKDRRYLEDCLNILADLLQNHNPRQNFPRTFPEEMMKTEVLAGPNQTTWLLILRAFNQFGQLKAAERILGEVWKKAPLGYDMCCDEMMGAYLAIGEKDKAMLLLQRKLNAGWIMTDFTLKQIARYSKERHVQQTNTMPSPAPAPAPESFDRDFINENPNDGELHELD